MKATKHLALAFKIRLNYVSKRTKLYQSYSRRLRSKEQQNIKVFITYREREGDSCITVLLNMLAELAVTVPRGKPFHSRRQYVSSSSRRFRVGHERQQFHKLKLYF